VKAFSYEIEVTAVTPDFGPHTGGTAVTVTGADFQAGATVMIGAAVATVTGITPTEIQAVTPPGPAGYVTVRILNPDGSFGELADGFEYVAPLSLSLISPTSGTVNGGTVVHIYGNGMERLPTVFFGGVECSAVGWISRGDISTIAPGGSPGAVDVTVRNPDGTEKTLSGAYTYVAYLAPSITDLTPATGPECGGTLVTITGSDFHPPCRVDFGSGNPSGYVSYVGPGELVAAAPAGSGTVNVTVTNVDGQSSGSAATYAYLPDPVIASVSPSVGAAGDTVTITGSGFEAGATVEFGPSNPATVTSSSATQLEVTAPAGNDCVTIIVTNPTTGRRATLYAGFSYTSAAPVIRSVSPAQGSIGATITIYGAGFADTPVVEFDAGRPSSSATFIDAGKIQAVVPAGSGVADIIVTNPDLQSAFLKDAFAFPPRVDSIAPAQGPTAGGTGVSITGAGFGYVDGCRVFIGAREVAPEDVTVTATRITAVTPPGSAGTASVRVVNNRGGSASLADAFTFVPPPVVGTISPGKWAGAGSSVTIYGANFKATPRVRFGPVAGSSVSFVSDYEITVVPPSGASGTVVDVTIENPDGQTGVLAGGFEY
jgi:hypothetical protein